MAADSAISRVFSAPNRLRKAIGSNFYYSFLFLPASKRKAITNVYQFARILDDIVDNDQTGRNPEAELQYWRDEVEYCYLGQPETSIGEELMMSIDEFDIPKQPFMDLIEGMEMDLKWSSYQTFADLREYCYRAASAVGLICIEIFGYDSPGTREYAVNLGLALQLTNILRDLQEDAARGRIYIPIEDLERFGYSEQDLKANVYNRPFVDLMKYQHKRARYYFERAAAILPEQERPSMVAAEIMGAIYKELLDKIQEAQFDVYRNRITVSKMQRLKIALNIWFKTRFGK
jgi:phytoene synthase